MRKETKLESNVEVTPLLTGEREIGATSRFVLGGIERAVAVLDHKSGGVELIFSKAAGEAQIDTRLVISPESAESAAVLLARIICRYKGISDCVEKNPTQCKNNC